MFKLQIIKKKKVLNVCAISFGILLLIATGPGYFIYQTLNKSDLDVDPHIIFSDSIYAEYDEKSFLGRYIQSSQEKDPVIRLEKYESLMAEGDAYQRFTMMTSVAKTAFTAEHYEKAQSYATELVKLAPQYKYDWNYGNAIHDGHLVLGRIAVKNGDIDEAKNQLNLAGKTPGSPQLKSFGPNMSLANDLLKAGERKIVIEYLKDCKKFWEMNDGRLDSWIASIKGGGKPYFGTSKKF